MKAHALSLSFLLAVLPALSHPVAVPAADAQQQRESWQLPWSNGGGFVHAYRGPVREEFLQCDRGQCPLPAHGGTVPASGTAEGLSSAEEPATPSRQDETAAQGKAEEKAGQPAAKGQEVRTEQGIPPREKQPPATAATVSPAAARQDMAVRAEEAPSVQAASGEPAGKKRASPSATTSRPVAGTSSGAVPAQKTARAGRDATPASGADSPSNTATTDTSVPVTDEKAAYQAGLDLILSGRLDEGMARMLALLEQHPSGRYAANAEYWLGEALSSLGRDEEALKHFRNVDARYPRHHKNADALLRTGMILKQQGDTAGASKAFRQVVQRFPTSAAADLIRKKGLVQP